ncbi:MAG: hydroxyacid dehydrogenase [Planctomycetota bacterium]
MKIGIFELEDWEREVLESLEDDHDVVLTDQPLNQETAEEHSDLEIISTFIYSDLDKQVLETFDQLKLIATRSVGYDHIDLDWCSENDVSVCNVPNYGQNTVAEHVFGLILTISHNLYEAIDRTRKGDFSFKGLQGFDLAGQTLGVIGTGDIGQAVIRVARGFQMDVVAFDKVHNDQAADELGFQYVEMDDLLAESDIITLHVPGTEKTRHLISHDQFEKMKDGVVIINTSRGQVLDVEALTAALSEGKVSAAGLDVLPEEPVLREETELLRSVYQKKSNRENLLADHILIRLRNVYITPHSAFNTRQAVHRILDTTRENILKFADGHGQNLVSEDSED